ASFTVTTQYVFMSAVAAALGEHLVLEETKRVDIRGSARVVDPCRSRPSLEGCTGLLVSMREAQVVGVVDGQDGGAPRRGASTSRVAYHSVGHGRHDRDEEARREAACRPFRAAEVSRWLVRRPLVFRPGAIARRAGFRLLLGVGSAAGSGGTEQRADRLGGPHRFI